MTFPIFPFLTRLLIGAATLAGATLGRATAAPTWETLADTWVATDGLGRTLPDHAKTGAPRKDRQVGIFYFLWNEGQNPVYDLTKIVAKDPENPTYGPPGSFHHWEEPLFGITSRPTVM